MQYLFSCTPSTFAGIEAALSTPRILKFFPAAGQDKNLALQLYVWDARICEAFYLPTQVAEVAIRNSIHKVLTARYGDEWHTDGRFTSCLSGNMRGALEDAIISQRVAVGINYTINDVVAALSLGFWEHLLTKNFYHLLWKGGIHSAFPNAPTTCSLKTLQEKILQFRRWRNKIAHHYAVFDQNPTAEHDNILNLIRWASDDLHWFAKQLSTVSRVINRRPKPVIDWLPQP